MYKLPLCTIKEVALMEFPHFQCKRKNSISRFKIMRLILSFPSCFSIIWPSINVLLH
eukprot:c27085_g1_i4 orf=1-168(-)